MFSHFGKIFGRLKKKMFGDYGDEEDGKDVRGNTDRKRFLSLRLALYQRSPDGSVQKEFISRDDPRLAWVSKSTLG